MTKETSNVPKLSKLWCVSTLMFVFPDLVTGSDSISPISTARGLSATQRKACMRSITTQKPKRLPMVFKCWEILRFIGSHFIQASQVYGKSVLVAKCRNYFLGDIVFLVYVWNGRLIHPALINMIRHVWWLVVTIWFPSVWPFLITQSLFMKYLHKWLPLSCVLSSIKIGYSLRCSDILRLCFPWSR